MRIKQVLLKAGGLFFLLLLSVLNMPKATAETFNTIDAVKSTLNLECIDYCITGTCIHIVCSPWCSISLSFQISHNLPELIVSVYDEVSEQPYDEYRPLQELLLGGFGNEGASLNLPEKTGSQPVIFKNASVIGHPFMLLFSSGGSSGLPEGYSYAEGKGYDGDNSNDCLLNNNIFVRCPKEKSPDFTEREKEMGAEGAMGDKDISSGFAEIIGSSVFYGFCPTKVQAFQPYYESTLDFFEWRYGVIDRFKAIQNGAHIPGNREIGSLNSLNPIGKNTWGAVYPRMGFVLQHEDPKAAAVIAQRAVDVVTRNDNWRIKTTAPIGASNEKTDLWQMISPKEDSSCGAFGSKDLDWSEGRNSDGKGQYGWNYWGRYKCCMDKLPILTQISMPPICLKNIL